MQVDEGTEQRRTGQNLATYPQNTDGSKGALLNSLRHSVSRRGREFIQNNFKQFHGKNYVVGYQDRFNFEEEWEDKAETNLMDFDVGIPNSKLHECIISILYVIFLGSIFVTTIDYFFKTGGNRQNYTVMYGLTIFGLLLDAGRSVQTYLSNRQTIYYDKWQIISLVYMQVFASVYYVLKIMDIPQRRNIIWAFFQIVFTLLLIYSINRIEYTYRFLRFLLGIQNQAKVVQIYIGLMLILHIMATILICTTYSNPTRNWLSSLNYDHQNEFSVYLRAFYFATTTILTVGYGDISPKNDLQIVVVTLIEMFGIVVFAYMINQIGYSMSNLRKEKQSIDKDLSSVQKIKQHYKMNGSMTNRLRTFVMNQKPTGKLLQPDAQHKLMSKLNQQLRQGTILLHIEVQQQNHLQIVKTSLFFLVRWSRDFQKEVAKKLTHLLLSPNQLLYQPTDKERIYIVRVGKVNIFAQRSRLKKGQRNMLKTISSQLGEQNFHNTYGWTAVLSKRATRLFAYAQDYTSTYFIDKGQFGQAIQTASTDFEYYNQIRDRLNQSSCWQAFQLPILQSSKHHYNPTRYIILRRQIENKSKNKRHSVKRRSHKVQRQSIMRGVEEMEVLRRKSDRFLSLGDVLDQSMSNSADNSTINQKNKRLSIREALPQKQEDGQVMAMFQAGKQYRNYFSRQNMHLILRKLQTLNYAACNKIRDDVNKSFYKPKSMKLTKLITK